MSTTKDLNGQILELIAITRETALTQAQTAIRRLYRPFDDDSPRNRTRARVLQEAEDAIQALLDPKP